MYNESDNPFLPEVEIVDRKEVTKQTNWDIQNASHPIVVSLHIGFKVISLFWYLFGGILSSNSLMTAVLFLLFVVCDFYMTKNFSGRFLVGLRWWSVVDETGNSTWSYETRKNGKPTNSVDSKCFWVFTVAFPIVWCVFAFFSLLRMNIFWLGVNCVALGLSGLNAYLYLQASKKTNQEVNLLNYIPGDVRDKAMKKIQSSLVNAVSSAASNLV